jgi:YVTN family beta-propeller protein
MRSPFFLAMLVASTAATAAAPVIPSYSVAKPIPAPDGSWDYARVDPVLHRLYVARGTSVTVIDLDGATPARSIGDIAHGHAVVPFDGGKRLLVTSGNDATVRILDAATGAELKRIAVGKKADAAILDAAGTAAYVMNADGGTISVINLATLTVTKTIPVKPALEYAAFAKDGMLFVNNEDAGEIDTVDVRTGVAGAPVALPGCEGPTGLAYDAPHERLISACANGKAPIVDAHARRLVKLVPIGLGPDAVILDPARSLAFIPCGKDGVLEILSVAGADVAYVGRLRTEVGARTGALDPATDTIYLPTATMAPPVKPGTRAIPVPGTFHVVVVRPS